MEKGPDIDPTTQKPIEADRDKKSEKEQKKELNLREQAAFINVMFSSEGQALISLIMRKLEQRIQKLISDDPEASAYSKILKEIKYKENLAKKAIDQIYKRQLK